MRSRKAGFTLVELAIVLVIIGLIIGGVLVGRDLIKAAELRASLPISMPTKPQSIPSAAVITDFPVICAMPRNSGKRLMRPSATPTISPLT